MSTKQGRHNGRQLHRRVDPKVNARHIMSRRIFNVVKIVLVVLGILIGAFLIITAIGRNHLFSNKKDKIPQVESDDGEVSTDDEGIVSYQGKKYKLKENVASILIMGVDNNNGYKITETSGKGQADCIMLAVMDLDDGALKLIAIPRDLMTEIAMYSGDGSFIHNYTGQICLQYAYGDGKDGSCKLMTEAVSNLLYGVPIQGYAALKMNAIATANDAIGGVTVTIPDDSYFCKQYGYTAGQTVTLKGKAADNFVRARNNSTEASLMRLNRQKIYLQAMVQQLIPAVKQDMTLPIKLYNQLSGKMYTSFSVDQVAYLATIITGLGFSGDNITTIQGEMTDGEVYNEYYADEQALYELVLDTFYQPV